MMRYSFALLAAAAVIAPSAGHANECPTEVTGEFETSLGETVAWLEPGQTVHTPAGLTILGKQVSYVIAKRPAEGSPIQQLDYRFGDLVRPYDQDYPLDLRQAFDQAFSASACGTSRNPVCAVAYSGGREGAGRLSGGKLSVGDLWIPDEARGPALPLVQADYDLESGDPVFLVCLY
jgi:hypothetical protein